MERISVEQEEKLLGSQIVVTVPLEYGGTFGNVRKGEKGIIVGYSRTSRNPIVELEWRRIEVIIPWKSLIII